MTNALPWVPTVRYQWQGENWFKSLCHSARTFSFRLVIFYDICLPQPISQRHCLPEFSLSCASGKHQGKEAVTDTAFFPSVA